MALDVYVGSLTRYYVGDWERALDKTGRKRGATSSGMTAGTGADSKSDRERIRTAVLAWREALAASLGTHLDEPLLWEEAADVPWFLGRLGWRGLGALVLWAAYAEQPQLNRPDAVTETWDDDPALVRSNDDGFRSRYSHLVRNVELWLPHPFDFTFEGEDVDGRRILFGSSTTLRRQLGELNEATWNMTPDEMSALSSRRAPTGNLLEPAARQAMAVMTWAVRHAVNHRLPMKLDY